MLKATADDGNVSITASGKLADLLTDTAQIIGGVYRALLDDGDGGSAGIYRELLIKSLNDPASGVWDTGITDSQPTQRDEEPAVKFGMLNLNGCETREDAAKALVSLLRSMGVPVPKDGTEASS